MVACVDAIRWLEKGPFEEPVLFCASTGRGFQPLQAVWFAHSSRGRGGDIHSALAEKGKGSSRRSRPLALECERAKKKPPVFRESL